MKLEVKYSSKFKKGLKLAAKRGLDIREGKTKKWLADQWGISQPSITQKFKDDNWKESDIKKFCSIMNLNYEIIFTDKGSD